MTKEEFEEWARRGTSPTLKTMTVPIGLDGIAFCTMLEEHDEQASDLAHAVMVAIHELQEYLRVRLESKERGGDA